MHTPEYIFLDIDPKMKTSVTKEKLHPQLFKKKKKKKKPLTSDFNIFAFVQRNIPIEINLVLLLFSFAVNL